MYKLVLFDKDGTLLNFEKVWLDVGIRFVDDFIEHFNVSEDRLTLQRKIGIDGRKINPNGALASGTAKSYIKILSQYTQEASLQTWIDQQMKYYAHQYANRFEMIKGTDKIIKQLKQDGYMVGMVTNDDLASSKRFLDQFDLLRYFDILITNDSQPHQKPDARVLIPTLKYAHAEEIIMIGDTPSDMLFGKQAEVGLTIGVLSGTGGQSDLKDADLIIESVDAIYKGDYIWKKD